ncbi:UNVERIFIED_CONTAM: hypothetical protein GTU68_060417 [Idotea baltica]|nr:hypothetical protein [Idotea baltica]
MNERLKPVGTVCVQGEKCEGVVVAAAATSGATGGSARSADEIIGAHCGACHTTGVLGAPKIGDSAEWKKRVKEQGGLDKLLARAISGFNAMPPKGTCSDCTKDEIKSVITKMSGLSF